MQDITTAGRNPDTKTRRLWSLWDMLELNAARFVGLSSWLRQMQMAYLNPAPIEHDGPGSSPLSQENLDRLVEQARRAIVLAEETGLVGTSSIISRLIIAVGNTENSNIKKISNYSDDISYLLGEISIRMKEELEGRKILLIDASVEKFYGNNAAFGDAVNLKFREAASDIRNASNCLAVDQPTACVLHLGRVMEVVCRSLAVRLKVSVGGRDTIGSLLNNMTPKIAAMPDRTVSQKAKKERWAEARVHLFHVKQAWRDNSMHARRDYSQSHATEIFLAVRSLTAHLAAL